MVRTAGPSAVGERGRRVVSTHRAPLRARPLTGPTPGDGLRRALKATVGRQAITPTAMAAMK
eukprot:8864285-Alexandrium_andersonii.AAC.1